MKPQTWSSRFARRLLKTRRLSRQTVSLAYLLAGAALVALTALFFAKLADYALTTNLMLAQKYPWFVWTALPPGLMLIVWLTQKFAPHAVGSGIPQVIASIALPHSHQKKRLVAFRETLLKIPLTFLGMLAGASIGREGPSVQVGAAVMSAWGRWCRKRGLAFQSLRENDLLAAGAAGGLAAAFNAPLAGVVFAIEELGRAVLLRWERQIFIGILAAGFVQVAIEGNNPHFRSFYGVELKNMLPWVAGGAVVCGIAGGLFARLLLKGPAWLLPEKHRGLLRRHPVLLAGVIGLLLAALATLTGNQTLGTGYYEASAALRGTYDAPPAIAAAKWAATVLSYWAGIPGGVFTPSLTIGAMIGQHIADLSGLGVGANVVVLLCMTAFLSAATQSPLTSSVVVMEMTGSQSLLFWLLIGSLIAAQVSRRFSPKPFYHAVGQRFKQRIEAETAAEEKAAKQAAQPADAAPMPSENRP
ncbi:chloride channel protein [Neisseria leonii]|uniref:chloride channel protein n=1 Tax=Neisseria leonii TaxID=2995413 RepID=UPI00237B1C5A|nr:chloride channel protein [Neisseria sp. 3986]MDD9326185.1 chloride channel protein [Neisseria sp. 3986]